MDDPRGSVEHAASNELERLRRRAYGPDADIAADVAAQARLSELEGAQRRQPTPVVDAAAWVSAPIPERAQASEPAEGLTNGREHGPTTRDATGGEPSTDGERLNGQALGGAAIPSPPAALETKPRGPYGGRVRRLLPWVIAAVAIGVLVVSESSEPRPVARLAAQAGPTERPTAISDGIAVQWHVMGADFVSHGSYGEAEIWSTTIPGPKQCLGVVVQGSTWRFNCTATTLDTIADIDIDPNVVPPAPSGERGSNIRFVLHDGVVDVYLAPHPDGGFYP